ncbi:hypothetical protein ACIRO1_33495 [Streptomyces sp. NPDC102381]|uniref:hypothetical protein n=1 Tax=Streptomyces sp. NPDC102381 TaxID=3366164 RepID=UPI00381E9BA9
MLNPIDAKAVIRDGGATGHHPRQIHAGVAWWLGACLVVTQKASHVVVAHDGEAISTQYATRFARGAINALHYKCLVTALQEPTEPTELGLATADLGSIPSAHISTTPSAEVTVALFDADGKPLTEESGLAAIRDLIAQDRVPIPVNDAARGTIEYRGQA